MTDPDIVCVCCSGRSERADATEKAGPKERKGKAMLITDPLFPSDLTPEEEVAGFKKVEILAPHAYQGDGHKTIMAVVYSCGPSHRVIKKRNLEGRRTYKLEQFGVFAGSPDYEEPDWLPVGVEVECDPNVAVEDAARRMREAAGPAIESRIPPKIERSE